MTEEAEELLGTGDLPTEPVEPIEDSNHESAVRKPNFTIAKQKAKLQGRKEMADELAGFQEQLLSAFDARLEAKLANLAGVNRPTNPAMPFDEESLINKLKQQVTQEVTQSIYQSSYNSAVEAVKGEYNDLISRAIAKNPDLKEGVDLIDFDSMDLVAAKLVKLGIDNSEDVIAAFIEDPASVDNLMGSLRDNPKRGEAALRKYAKGLHKVNTTISRARNSNIPAPSGQVRSNPGGAHQDDDSWDDLANDPSLR